MFGLPPAVRIFVAVQPVDMRRSFDGLAAIARDVLGQDPFSGHLFVLFGRSRDRVKILFWDRSGFWLHCKRLEAGRFALPKANENGTLELDGAQLALILEGLDLRDAKRRRRYQRPGATAHLPDR